MTLTSSRPSARGVWAHASAWSGRLAGVDAARAVALVGMFAAHVADAGTRGLEADGWRWLWIADGRSSALFAVLAGVTMSLMGRTSGAAAQHTAARVAIRGGVLIVAGYALDVLGTPVDVILANLGLMFLLAIPALRWRAVILAVSGAVVLVVGGALLPTISGFADGVPVIEKIASRHYPAIVWAGYVLIGMAVGRFALRTRRVAIVLAGAGAIVAAVAYGSGALLGGALPWDESRRAHFLEPSWASIAPHSNTPFELMGNAAVALLVIGVCLLAVRPSPWTFPALAFGSMSLTMYTAHLLVIAAVGDDIVWQPSNVAFGVMTAALIVTATTWRVAIGSGPLERALTWVSRAGADAATRVGYHSTPDGSQR